MSDVFYKMAEILNCIPEVLIIFLFYNRILEKKYDLSVIYFIVYMFEFVIFAAAAICIDKPYIRVSITFILLFVSAIVLYQNSITKKFFTALYYFLIIFISETLFMGIITLLGYGSQADLLNSGVGRIIGMVGTKIFDFWIVIYSCRIYKNKARSLPINYWIQILLMPFLSSAILLQIYSLDLLTNKEIILYIITITGILYLNFSVFNYFESYDKQVRLTALEQIMEQENRNYKAMANSYSEIRSIKHDLINQVSVLNDLINKNQIDEAHEYMNNMYKMVETATSIYYTGNSAADSVVNLKAGYARSLGIKFIAQIQSVNIDFDAVNICRILGNALDNAIEACERIDNEDKFIMLTIKEMANNLVIEIDNSSLSVDINNMATTKTDKKIHGIGLYSIEYAVKQINGLMTYEYADNVFSLKIVIMR